MWTKTDQRSDTGSQIMGWFMVGVLLAGAAPAHALSTDRDQPIIIEADRAERDDAKRIAIYRGNVVIDQGTLHITGDTVTTYFDDQDGIMKLISVGGPAHFRQRIDESTEYRKAWANRMEYFIEEDFIVLFGEAHYKKGESDVRAERLMYDSVNARFKALTGPAATPANNKNETPEQKPSRVKIKIERSNK